MGAPPARLRRRTCRARRHRPRLARSLHRATSAVGSLERDLGRVAGTPECPLLDFRQGWLNLPTSPMGVALPCVGRWRPRPQCFVLPAAYVVESPRARTRVAHISQWIEKKKLCKAYIPSQARPWNSD